MVRAREGGAEAPDPDPAPLVLVAGLPRSGSTLCGRLLAQLFVAGFHGELMHVDALWLPDEVCGCGIHLHFCPQWSLVSAALQGWADLDLRRRIRAGVESPDPRRTEALVPLFRALLGAIPNDVPLVDSSKIPAFADVLAAAAPERAMHVVHLVRDPSAVIASASARSLPKPDGSARLKTFPARDVADRWRRHNAQAVALGRRSDSYHLVRLQDLVARPAEVLGPIAAAIGLVRRIGPAPVSHSLRGNPARFEELAVDPIRAKRAADVRWLPVHRLRALAGRRYGYPLVER